MYIYDNMSIRLLAMVFMFCFNGRLSAQVEPCCSENLSANQNPKMLIIEGSANETGLSFAPFRMINGDMIVDEFEYASHPTLGSGFEIDIEIPQLDQYSVVFVKLDLGSFSTQLLDTFAYYVLQGGKMFVLLDPKDKSHFVKKMEENINYLVSQCQIKDRIKLSRRLLNNEFRTGVLTSIEQKGKYRKDAIERTLERKYLSSLSITFGITSASDLSEAYKVFQFKNDDCEIITNVFWKKGDGSLGVGTESSTSSYFLKGSLEANKMMTLGLDL